MVQVMVRPMTQGKLLPRRTGRREGRGDNARNIFDSVTLYAFPKPQAAWRAVGPACAFIGWKSYRRVYPDFVYRLRRAMAALIEQSFSWHGELTYMKSHEPYPTQGLQDNLHLTAFGGWLASVVSVLHA